MERGALPRVMEVRGSRIIITLITVCITSIVHLHHITSVGSVGPGIIIMMSIVCTRINTENRNTDNQVMAAMLVTSLSCQSMLGPGGCTDVHRDGDKFGMRCEQGGSLLIVHRSASWMSWRYGSNGSSSHSSQFA